MPVFSVEVETDGGGVFFDNIAARDKTEAQGIALKNAGSGRVTNTEQVTDV